MPWICKLFSTLNYQRATICQNLTATARQLSARLKRFALQAQRARKDKMQPPVSETLLTTEAGPMSPVHF